MTEFRDMTRADQADPAKVLREIKRTGGFGTFEAGSNAVIAKTITNLFHKSLTRVDPDGTFRNYGVCLKDIGGHYPHTKVALTEGGERLLADEPEQSHA